MFFFLKIYIKIRCFSLPGSFYISYPQNSISLIFLLSLLLSLTFSLWAWCAAAAFLHNQIYEIDSFLSFYFANDYGCLKSETTETRKKIEDKCIEIHSVYVPEHENRHPHRDPSSRKHIKLFRYYELLKKFANNEGIQTLKIQFFKNEKFRNNSNIFR